MICKQIYLMHRWDHNSYYHSVILDLGVMAMKGYSILPRSPEQDSLAGWGCKIYRLPLCTGVRPDSQCSGYEIKQSDGEVSVMLELWGIQTIPSLILLPGPL